MNDDVDRALARIRRGTSPHKLEGQTLDFKAQAASTKESLSTLTLEDAQRFTKEHPILGTLFSSPLEHELKLPWVIESIMVKVAGSAKVQRLDSQSYWLYEFSGVS